MLFALITMGTVTFWGSVLYLALRFVRASEQRGVARGELDELRTRVTQLEEELDATRAETERLAAAEAHTMMLLTRRTAPPERAP